MILLWPLSCWNKGTPNLIPYWITHGKPCKMGYLWLVWWLLAERGGHLACQGWAMLSSSTVTSSFSSQPAEVFHERVNPKQLSVAVKWLGRRPAEFTFPTRQREREYRWERNTGKMCQVRTERKFILSLLVLYALNKYMIAKCLLSS